MSYLSSYYKLRAYALPPVRSKVSGLLVPANYDCIIMALRSKLYIIIIIIIVISLKQSLPNAYASYKKTEIHGTIQHGL